MAVSIDLPIEASIPIEYIDSDKLRLEAYRKLASARNEADLKDLEEELTDRYGKPPVEFETLFDVARLKFKARKLGISEILAQSNRVRTVASTRPNPSRCVWAVFTKAPNTVRSPTSSSSPPRSPAP